MWLTNSKSCHKTLKQQGFSLVELMIGLVIGLMVALVVTNVFSVFEKQKRTTTGSSDAQTNGAIALYNLQRDAQSAGYGLPVYGSTFSPYNCPMATTVDHDNNGGTANIGMSPIVITDGVGQNGSDTISIRSGDSMRGGVSMPMVPGTATILPNVVQVDTNIGCAVGDVALAVNYAIPTALNCNMTRVTALTAAGVSPATITLANANNVAAGNAVACLGVWDEFQYTVNANNQLTRSGALVGGVPSVAPVPIVTDIVNMQAQYGVSAVTPAIGQASNQVIQWVDATGIWDAAAITPSNRNRIKAIRVAVVARNGLLEAANVTAACSALDAANPTGLCAWAGSTASPAPAVSLVADPNWMRYRYRVYETIIPIKNVIWSRQTLQ